VKNARFCGLVRGMRLSQSGLVHVTHTTFLLDIIHQAVDVSLGMTFADVDGHDPP